MEKIFIEKNIEAATYYLKEGTKTSYYREESESNLPNRITCTFNGWENPEAKPYRRVIYNGERFVGDVFAKYTKYDDSIYKQLKPYVFSASVYRSADYPQLLGYGMLCITTENGTEEIGLLAVNKLSDTRLTLYFMFGITVADKLEMLDVVSSIVEKNIYGA